MEQKVSPKVSKSKTTLSFVENNIFNIKYLTIR